jgi:hypothetical protein
MASVVRQNAFTVIAPLESRERIAEAARALASIDPVTNDHPSVNWSLLTELHYCSFVIVERKDRPAYVTFEGNIDGSVKAFFAKLADSKEWCSVLEAVFEGCKRRDSRAIRDYLLRHDAGPGTWYVAHRGRSAAEIRREADLRARIEAFLDGRPDLRERTQEEVRGAIRRAVEADPTLAWTKDPSPKLPFLVRNGRTVTPLLLAAVAGGVVIGLWGLGPVAALAVVAVVAAFVWLLVRRLLELEKADAERQKTAVAWHQAPIEDSDVREDHTLQNHMCSVTEIKAGPFRRALLALSLGVVGLAHRFWFNQGDLGGIPTIHFARWIVAPGTRDLIFFSNYDGSWERYLGDFIEQASTGLNSIWSNTDGYPATRFLVLDGANDEERFKAFARNSMHQTRVWYAADRKLSIRNIGDDAKLREGLFAPLEGEALREWLRLL